MNPKVGDRVLANHTDEKMSQFNAQMEQVANENNNGNRNGNAESDTEENLDNDESNSKWWFV